MSGDKMLWFLGGIHPAMYLEGNEGPSNVVFWITEQYIYAKFGSLELY